MVNNIVQKRVIALLLVISIILSMTACTGTETKTPTDNENPAEVAIVEAPGEEESEQTVDIQIDQTKTQEQDEPSSENIGQDESSVGKDGQTNVDPVIEDETDNLENVAGVVDEYNAGSEFPASDVEISDDSEAETFDLSTTTRNSLNMLNYMTVLSQQIDEDKKNQLALQSIYNSLSNDIYPNSVDTNTQQQINKLLTTIHNYTMIDVKRERIEYIYEQNRAQALRQAIPNPLGLLSAVQSGNVLKIAASVLYMAVDSASSYTAATSQADLQFLQDGWELDDAESAELHNSTLNQLNFMFDMVRKYDLPGDYALNKEAVNDFVLWTNKPDSQLVGKIKWLESHRSTYEAFGSYWLELAKDYYNYEKYDECLNAVHNYESVSTRVFKKDIDYAQVLPMAIISAKETLSEEDYVGVASRYCELIKNNTKDDHWALRYFAAQIYLDLYAITDNQEYLDESYTFVFENVNNLVDEQRAMNDTYMADIVLQKAEKGATKRIKKEIKSYNNIIEAERKVALPPVSEALYLNCDMLFALAKEKTISAVEQEEIDKIIHVDGDPIFLTKALDNRFRFGNNDAVDSQSMEISFKGKELAIPATCISDRSSISVTVTGDANTATFDDWIVTEVKRPKNVDCSGFIVTLESETAKDYKYQDGETVTITVVPVVESPDQVLTFNYKVIGSHILFVINSVKFERVL